MLTAGWLAKACLKSERLMKFGETNEIDDYRSPGKRMCLCSMQYGESLSVTTIFSISKSRAEAV